jgi:hypothetical protein
MTLYKNIFQYFIIVMSLLQANGIGAQAKNRLVFCQNLFIQDYTDTQGRKLPDPALTDDTESIFKELLACKPILRQRSPAILVDIKNEQVARQGMSFSCRQKVSDELCQQLREKQIYHLYYGCVEESPNMDKVRIHVMLEQLSDRSIVSQGTLELSRYQYNHRVERKEHLQLFLEREILRLPPPISKRPIYLSGSGALIGAGVTTYQLISAYQLRQEWLKIYAQNPTDPKKLYAQQDKQYLKKQYVAIGSGALTLLCGSIFWHHLMRQRRVLVQHRSVVKNHHPYEFTPSLSLSSQGVGLTWQF